MFSFSNAVNQLSVARESTDGRYSTAMARLRLAPRQKEVVALLERSNLEIAQILGITEQTVKSHVKHALRKNLLANRTALFVAYLREQGLASTQGGRS